MLTDIINQAAASLEDVFQADEVNLAARKAKVVIRTSKMDGACLLQTLTFGFLQNPQASLSQLCQTAQDVGVQITRQGLDERMTEATADFLLACLSKVLQRLQGRCGLAPEVLKQFSEVYLQDSTIQSLPESLQELFPGSGGNASPAALKIQVLFGLLSGNLSHVELQTGRSSDAHYTNHVPCLEKNSLLIRDLGFFNLEALQDIHNQEAFFLMRWRADVTIFLADQLDTSLDMLRFLSAQSQPVGEYTVWVGKTARLACRMLVVHLPHEVADQRKQRLRQDAQRLSVQQILICYALRWQVELIFKLWKSQAGLRFLPGKRKGRILCEVYAKLIGIALTHFLLAPLHFFLIDQNIEISLPKAHKILQYCARHLFTQIGQDHLALHTQLEDLFLRILRSATKDKRVKNPSTLQRLALANLTNLACLFP
jgi:hypothetical protein